MVNMTKVDGTPYNPDKHIYAYESLDGKKDRKKGIIRFTTISWDSFRTVEHIRASFIEKIFYLSISRPLESFSSWWANIAINTKAIIVIGAITIICNISGWIIFGCK